MRAAAAATAKLDPEMTLAEPVLVAVGEVTVAEPVPVFEPVGALVVGPVVGVVPAGVVTPVAPVVAPVVVASA